MACHSRLTLPPLAAGISVVHRACVYSAFCQLCCACAADRVVTESLAVLASVAEQRDHFPAVMAALLDCFRGNGGARLLQVGAAGLSVLCWAQADSFGGALRRWEEVIRPD